jgi:hypothetical protein
MRKVSIPEFLLFAVLGTLACSEMPPEDLGGDGERREIPTATDSPEQNEADAAPPPEITRPSADGGADAGATPDADAGTRGCGARGKVEIEPNDDDESATEMGAATCGSIAEGEVDQLVTDGHRDERIDFEFEGSAEAQVQVTFEDGKTAKASGASLTGRLFPGRQKVFFRISRSNAPQDYRITIKRR